MNELAPHFFHGHALGLMRLGMGVVRVMVEARTGAAAKLLSPQRGDIDEQEPVCDGGRRLDDFVSQDHIFLQWRFKFHNVTGYRNLRRFRKSGIRDREVLGPKRAPERLLADPSSRP